MQDCMMLLASKAEQGRAEQAGQVSGAGQGRAQRGRAARASHIDRTSHGGRGGLSTAGQSSQGKSHGHDKTWHCSKVSSQLTALLHKIEGRNLLNGFSVHVISDLELRQIRQLALIAEHDLHVAPHRAGPAAAVPPTTQLAPPTAFRCKVFSVKCRMPMVADLLPGMESLN